MGPEDRERLIEIKRISRDSILGSHPLVTPGWCCHKCYGQTVFSEDLGPCIPTGRTHEWGEVEKLY
jgi:hypothetical protein